MSDPTQQQLKQAYDLIKAKQRQQAIDLLVPLLQTDEDNVNAWWLLANAVSDPNDAREALENVLRLRPDHENAQKLLNQLNERYPPPPPPVPEPEEGFDFGSPTDDDFWAAAEAGIAEAEPAPTAEPFGAPAQPLGAPARAAPAEDPFAAPSQAFGAPARPTPADDPFAVPVSAEVADLGAPVGGPAVAAKPKKSSSNRTLLIILAVIGVVAVCVCVACVAVTVVLPSMGISLLGQVFDSAAATLEAQGIDIGSFDELAATMEAGGFPIDAGGGVGSSLPSGVIQRGSLNVGDTRQDTLNPGERHTWTFTGNAGDPVVINVDAAGSAWDPLAELYDASNVQIASDDDGGNGLNPQLVIALPTSGTYTILIRTFGTNASAGAYELRLSNTIPADTSGGGPGAGVSSSGVSGSGDGSPLPANVTPRGGINYGESRSDTLTPGGQQTWTFNGNAGDALVIEVLSSNFDAQVALYGPDNRQIGFDDDGGEQFNSRLTITLAAGGPHTILVKAFADVGEGGYELRLNRM